MDKKAGSAMVRVALFVGVVLSVPAAASISLFVCAMVIAPPMAAADEIVLENGDRLTGTLVRMEKGVLTLKTAYSPPIDIRVSAIREIITDHPVDVRLSSGEVLKGTMRWQKPGQTTVAPSDRRGVAVIEREKVVAINRPPVKWEGGITIGGNMQRGNTQTTGVSAAAEGTRRGERDRFSLRYLFNYGEEESKVTTRNHFGAVKYDYFFLRKVYGYVGAEILNDKFRDIRLRTTVGPGMGYQVWEDPVKKALGLEGGVSYLSENHYVGANSDSWAGRLGLNSRYNLGKYLVFTDLGEFFPSLEQGDQYRLRNEATVSAPLGSKWALRLSHILEYSSDPPDETKKTDTTMILGLQYEF